MSFQGRDLYVYSVDGYYKGQEYVATYHLREISGFHKKKYYNLKIVGASLDGLIAEIQKDQVKIKLSADFPYGSKAIKWFPYASVYSSPDGTGWYCMPEIGDSVRLYFPSEKEEESYVINAVHVSEAEEAQSMRGDPDHKILMNKHKKMIKFSPTSIIISNNKGMSITLDDAEGVNIVSDKDITLTADKALNIISSDDCIEMISPEKIEFSQNDNSITIKDNIDIVATKIKVQQ